MINNKVFKLTKEALLDALRRSRYDIRKISPVSPRGGLFTNPKDVERSRKLIERIISMWVELAGAGKEVLPSNQNQMDRFVEIAVADKMALDATMFINSQLRNRSNQELVKEAREAISYLKEIGAEDKAYMYEYMFKRRVGEE